MPTTSPDGIDYPDTSYTSGFIAAVAALATSIQTAFSKRQLHSYLWADATARGAQAGMSAGDTGYQTDTNVYYRYNGTAWSPQGKMIFTRSAANLASSGSASTLDLATKSVDVGTFTDSAGVFTCALAGKYAVKLTWNFAASATGTRNVRIVHSVAGARDFQVTPGSGLDVTMSVSWDYVDFAVGDTLTTQGQQNSGSTLAVAGELTFEKVA